MEQLRALAKQWGGQHPDRVEPLSASGSNRRYFRFFFGRKSIIGVKGTCIEENKTFIAIADYFRKKKLPVPRILAISPECDCYLQQDLGNRTLFDAIKTGRETGLFSPDERMLLCETIRQLPRIQFEGAEGFNFNLCYPQSTFDKRTILWDLNYFKYCFLKLTGLEFREDLLENDFDTLLGKLLAGEAETFMYRDFQSRNVMLYRGKPYFIDFQGGRKGPILYDLASFIGQAKARFTPEIKEELIAAYFDALQNYTTISEKLFRNQLQLYTFFRTLQVLGAYGFRGYFEHKSHFLQSIPYAIENLRELLKNPLYGIPYFNELLEKLTDMEKFRLPEEQKGLTVTVYSFSYQKGIPDDYTGNGGGFIFDCRALDNPGRYEQYRKFTGLDKAVIRFFDKHSDIYTFIDRAKAIIAPSIQNYIERKFSHLMIAFGCTGGQHRSVFAAQRTAEYISDQFKVRVRLIHREQNKEKIFLPGKNKKR